MKKDPTNTFMRSISDAKIAGVCSGIAKYSDIDPTIIRLIFLFLIFANFTGVVAYIMLWIVMPNDSEEYKPND